MSDHSQMSAATDYGSEIGGSAEVVQRDLEIISKEFDTDFYVKNCPVLLFTRERPEAHYLRIGWRELRDPSPAFSTAYYLETNPDVRDGGINPFVHFIGWGRAEGRLPSPRQDFPVGKPPSQESSLGADAATVIEPSSTGLITGSQDERLTYERAIIVDDFDPNFYMSQSPRLSDHVVDPVLDYLREGWRNLLDPSPAFSTAYYLATNPDVRESGINPFVHFVGWGRAEGRSARPTAWPTHGTHDHQSDSSERHLSEITDVTERNSTQPREPNERLAYERALIADHFQVDYYRRQDQSLQGLAIDLVLDYLQRGWAERLDPSPEFSTSYYLESNPDVRDSGINPFVHYIGWGKAEGRKPRRVEEGPNRNLGAQEIRSQIEEVRAYFDPEYYLERSPDLAGSNIDLLEHYMNFGWRELRDPSRAFSTSYYLEHNPDIRAANMNPFHHYVAHGRREGRKALSYSNRITLRPFSPRVTAIVPNFNHARFLKKRLDSILQQSYSSLEILILDDASTDASVEVIREYELAYPGRIRSLLNSENSGNVFSQWRKGISNATGELIWICESDDFCEPDFVERCIAPFRDPSVMITFGRVQFADNFGKTSDGLDNYREQAEPGIWGCAVTRPASQWFRGTFAISNVIPNVGGCVIRNQTIPESVWTEALTYKISGDWYLYCILANGGQIAYVPEAVAYFRQHGKNTSVSGFLKAHYYTEHERIIVALRKQWGAPDDTAIRFYANVNRQFHYAKARMTLGKLANLYSNDRVLESEKIKTHILICFLGFHLGGGELFPIHLANELISCGYIVSVMCIDSENENPLVKGFLDKRIAVYDAQLIEEIGIEKFIDAAGIDVIHSHSIGVEFFFFQKFRFRPSIPYIVTLHGSYEVTPIPEDMLLRVLRSVSHWLYLSQKNLEHLNGIPVSRDRVSFIANGMPKDDREFPKTRSELGVGEGDILMTIASRAIREKGWRIAILATKLAQRVSDRTIHLMLCGTGPEADLLSVEFSSEPNIHFAGFQEKINGAYKISDIAILPTRFPGESYPLSLIQAMQVGCPIISTDIGEIPNMLLKGDLSAGIVCPMSEDDSQFAEEVSAAIIVMLNDGKRKMYAAASKKLGVEYSMPIVAANYINIYKRYAKET